MTNSKRTSRVYEQSDDRPYKSTYKEGYVCAADYICELVFQKRAKVDKSGVPQSFWNSPNFKSQYQVQAMWARRLLDNYDPTVIIKAFENTPYCLSLSNKKMKPLLEQYQKMFECEIKQITKPEVIVEQPRKPIGKGKNILEEL